MNKRKTAILLTALMIAAMSILITYIPYKVAYISAESATIELMSRISDATIIDIDHMMGERAANMMRMSGNPILGSDTTSAKQKTTELMAIRDTYGLYSSIAIFDTNLTKIADTSMTGIGRTYEPTPSMRDAMRHNQSIGGYRSMDPCLGKEVIEFAARLHDEKGQTKGIILSKTPLSTFQNALSPHTTPEMTVDLIDKNGAIIASTSKTPNIMAEARPQSNQAVKIALERKSSGVAKIEDPEGRTLITAYKADDGYLRYPKRGWIAMTSIREENMPSRIRIFGWMMILLPATLFVILITAETYLETRTKSSLKNILEHLKLIEEGKFNTRISLKKEDDLKELADNINQLIEQFELKAIEQEQLEKAKTEFLSITSHELRSPMTPIKAQLQMLNQGYYGRLNPQQKEASRMVIRNVNNLDKILMDFLDISRIEAARLKFVFTTTDLTPKIKELIREMQGVMPEKRLRIKLNAQYLPEIETDPDRVMQVLRNLLSNAIKFSNPGDEIIVNAEGDTGGIDISVKDEGIGIAKKNQGRIFEPFYQEEHTLSRSYGGTGLGLAICKGIVQSQGGRIWFESDKGKGSTFHFTIPPTPTKDIKPIKLLFSSNTLIETALKRQMTEYLGPIAESEMELLRKKGLTKENIIEYMDTLRKVKALDIDMKEFKKKIGRIFEEEQ